LSKAQRELVAKRRDLDALNAYIERIDALHAEALAVDGEFRQRLAAINGRLIEVGPMMNSVTMKSSRFLTDADLAEAKHLEDERAAVEREWQTAREARTTTWSDGIKTYALCEITPDDVAAKRSAVTRARDAVAAEMAAIERTLSPGELVQSGGERADVVEHRDRVERLRQRIG
jgi:hypothetical protein